MLVAAEACYAERGPSRTKMSDIAIKAGVHRSTVYYYFPNKDAVLAAAFVRALTEVLAAAAPCWRTDEPFLDRLVNACLVGNDTARRSPTARMLIANDEATHTYQVAESSDIWRSTLADALVERLAAAAAAGELRDDLPAETLARWITRVNFSLMAEAADPEDGGEEGVLRHLLAPSLAPRRGMP
ncbi:MAG: TetR/AcrR family transcriptional regulator [Mycolicibacterium sp.]|nr:TetR/AcrR family transcriptional regulator [Mycolicibacterium sp.]MBJ7337878.1 TetR/AcrR family transcriptional regulator [Mycolicibacterium sp.]